MSVTENSQTAVVKEFHQLHHSGCFLLPNPWDIGSAIFLERLGAKALATTSAGFAFSRGLADENVPLEMMLDHLSEIVRATSLPVNADFQAGYADDLETLVRNVQRCVATGVAGVSIEDNSGRGEQPLYEKDVALERVRAARKAIDDSGMPVVLTARCEAWLVDHPEPLACALDRLAAYAEAGADCLYAPGVSEPAEISTLVSAVAPKPLNVLVSGFNCELSLEQLCALGVRRVSVGSALAAMAWSGFLRGAREMIERGSFASLSAGTPFSEINGAFKSSGAQ